MAPKQSSTAGKTVTVDYNKYMDSHNEAIITAMSRVRESTKAVLTNGGLEELPESLGTYPALAALLSKDQSDLLNPLTIPSFGDLGSGVGGAAPIVKKLRKKRAPKDPDAPKRPQTAFFLYLDANRDAVKSELGSDGKPGDASKAMRDRWNVLLDQDKEIYKAMYRANMEGYRAELEEFKARGGKVADADLQPIDEDVAVANLDGVVDAESDSDSSEESAESEPEKTPTPEPPPATKRSRKAAAKAVSAKPAANAKSIAPAPAPPKQKSPEKKKGKAGAAPASTPATSKKSNKEVAKSTSPEETRKAPVSESPEVGKKKRKSTGPELEEKRKKRKEAHGDDF